MISVQELSVDPFGDEQDYVLQMGFWIYMENRYTSNG
jgi:hypothetical protein